MFSYFECTIGGMEDYMDDEMVTGISNLFPEPLKPKPVIHRCRDGTLMCLNYDRPYGKKIPRMTDDHLCNTYEFYKRRIKNGAIIDLEAYKAELRRRKLYTLDPDVWTI